MRPALLILCLALMACSLFSSREERAFRKCRNQFQLDYALCRPVFAKDDPLHGCRLACVEPAKTAAEALKCAAACAPPGSVPQGNASAAAKP